MHADDGGQGGVRRSRLLGLLVGASRPNPRPFSSSAPSATTRDDDDDDLLSRCRLRIPRKSGRAASAVERWAQEGGHVSQPELRHAVVRLRHARRYEQALEISSWIDSRNDFKLSPSDHTARLELIAKVHGTSQADEYYKNLSTAASKKAASFPLLHCYVIERNVQKAETFMAERQSCGLPVDPHSFNEMLKLYIATHQYEKVLSVIDLMKRNNIPRNVMSYNIWMNACAEVSGVASVQSAFKEMLNDDMVEVGWCTYCTLANIFRKYGQNSKALACLRMAETKLSVTGRLGYSFIMTCYAALNDRDGVTRLWEASERVPARIPVANYMTAMLCLIKVGDIGQAEWIFGSWEAECRKHDVRVSNVLLGAYVRNGWIEKAERLHLHMLEKGAHPNYKTREILMEGFVQSKQMDKAIDAIKKVLSLLKSCHWRPPFMLLEAIAEYFEEQGSVDDADRYIKVLQKFKLTSLLLYKSLLWAYINAGIVPQNIPQMITRDQIDMDDEMEQLIIHASKIDIRGNGEEGRQKNEDKNKQPTPRVGLERGIRSGGKGVNISQTCPDALKIEEVPRAALYDYQLQGLQWLLDNFKTRRSVILADEMGLGKTVQVVCFLYHIIKGSLTASPALILAPKSILLQWEKRQTERRRPGACLRSLSTRLW